MPLETTRQDDGVYRVEAETWLPRPVEEVFAFFRDAGNLQELTPKWVRFEVLTPQPVEMRPGAVIDYRLRIRGVPLRWRTRIELWDPPHQFADAQLKGPYRFWHHTHTFEPHEGGTVCRDVIRYVPRGGALTNRLFVQRDVERVFRYRTERLKELFPPGPADGSTPAEPHTG